MIGVIFFPSKYDGEFEMLVIQVLKLCWVMLFFIKISRHFMIQIVL